MRPSRLLLAALALLVLDTTALRSQQRPAARGTIVRAADGAPVPDATIVAPSSGRAARSGPDGRFTLSLDAHDSLLVARALGFAPETLAVAAGPMRVRLRAAPLELDPIEVTAEPAWTTASSATVRGLDIRLRPRESAQQLLALAPGLVIAQHAGGGKAEQIFLRGFDADHGTDVAVSVDGSPVNMVTHAHGQGYADLHFLLPEVVERVDVRKGPYDAADGDLATAGAVTFVTRDRAAAEAEVRGGSFGTGRAYAILPFGGDASRSGGYVAAAYQHSDGPFLSPQGYGRYNLFAKWTAPLGGAQLAVTASGFDASWDQSGQVPQRAVRNGSLSRFGSIDPTEGGTTHRYDVAATVQGGDEATSWQARVWGARYFLRLFSNFTFFLDDPVNGDGIEQRDDRVLGGAQAEVARRHRLGGRPARLAAGVVLRADAADVALHTQVRRTRLGTVTASRVRQKSGGLWLRQDVQLADRLRVQAGLRGDLFRFGVSPLGGAPSPDGDRTLGRVSPKLNVAFDAGDRTTLFASAGAGFHSNDARDAVQAGRGERVLAGAFGAELGVRHSWRGGSLAAAAWGLDLQSELVYVGDEGVTEPSGRTRRVGLDVEARVRLLPWLWADADLNLSRGRFRDEPAGADRIPLAPTVTSTGGLTVRDAGPVEGGVRYRHIGSRAADETNAVRARGYVVMELFASARVGPARLVAAVDNLLDTEWNEAQFATTSRLRDEAEPVTELHFTPGGPRSLLLGVEYRW